MTLRRNSWGEVSNAASSSAGATNSASARSGSIRIVGRERQERDAGAGDGEAGTDTAHAGGRAAAVSTTAANRRTSIHSKESCPTFSPAELHPLGYDDSEQLRLPILPYRFGGRTSAAGGMFRMLRRMQPGVRQ